MATAHNTVNSAGQEVVRKHIYMWFDYLNLLSVTGFILFSVFLFAGGFLLDARFLFILTPSV